MKRKAPNIQQEIHSVHTEQILALDPSVPFGRARELHSKKENLIEIFNQQQAAASKIRMKRLKWIIITMVTSLILFWAASWVIKVANEPDREKVKRQYNRVHYPSIP